MRRIFRDKPKNTNRKEKNAHTELVNEIQRRLADEPNIRVWPQNVIAGKLASGNYVTAGIKGMADISGIINLHLPDKRNLGCRLEIECKTGKAKQRKDQVAWQNMIEKFGGIYILARSVRNVEEALGLEHKIGYTKDFSEGLGKAKSRGRLLSHWGAWGKEILRGTLKGWRPRLLDSKVCGSSQVRRTALASSDVSK